MLALTQSRKKPKPRLISSKASPTTPGQSNLASTVHFFTLSQATCFFLTSSSTTFLPAINTPQRQHFSAPPSNPLFISSRTMAPPPMSSSSFVLVLGLHLLLASLASANFHRDVDVTWGDGRGKILNGGRLLTLSLDKYSGSGFQSKQSYLFSKIDILLKLVPGNSAGSVTTCYLSSQGDKHDEIDFEFLGNETGQPYTLHTNVFSQGKGNREQQFRLWFDPTADFHTYSILWNPQRIIFLVDGSAIREFKNMESIGVPFPKNQPMKLYSSLWNADDWATQGGRVKADWSKAPFTASFKDLRINSCSSSSCGSSSSSGWLNQELDNSSQQRMRWVQKNYMIYNYCTDFKRFPQGLPKECTVTA